MSDPWFKLWHELRHDKKLRVIAGDMGQPEAYIHGMWTDLLCFAHELDQGWRLQLDEGIPLSATAVVDEIRAPSDTAMHFLDRARFYRLLDDDSGTLYVTAGHARNAKPSDRPAATRERQAKSRAKRHALSRPSKRDMSRDRTEEKRVEKSEEPSSADDDVLQIAVENPPDLFIMFWERYPRKVGKATTHESWKRLKAGERRAAIIGAGNLAKWGKSKDKQFIPHPTTWLNQRRWEDWCNGPPDGYEAPKRSNAIDRCPKCGTDLTADEHGQHCPMCEWRVKT